MCGGGGLLGVWAVLQSFGVWEVWEVWGLGFGVLGGFWAGLGGFRVLGGLRWFFLRAGVVEGFGAFWVFWGVLLVWGGFWGFRGFLGILGFGGVYHQRVVRAVVFCSGRGVLVFFFAFLHCSIAP